jgi:hypothetical protein
MRHSKLPAIIAQLLEIHCTGKAQLHIDFMGHVDKIGVYVYLPKWESGKTPDLAFEGYVDKDSSWENFENEVNAFIKLFNAINQKQDGITTI